MTNTCTKPTFSRTSLNNIILVRRSEKSNYFSLATLKKTGDYVATPVWFACLDGAYVVFSAPDAGKIKRLRNFTQCRVAACNFKGALAGEWMNASARLLEKPADRAAAWQALRQKYGWQMKITDWLSGLSGKLERRVYIRIDLEPGASP